MSPQNILNFEEGTISLWFKPSSAFWKNEYAAIVNHSTAVNTNEIGLHRYGTSSKLLFCISNNSANWAGGHFTAVMSTTDLVADTWYHIVGKWSVAEGKFALYVNGVKESEANLDASLIPSVMGTFAVGHHATYPGRESNSLLDELRIDKIARTDEEIAGWYKANAPFYTSEDMKQWPGYLKLETDGIKVYDSSDALRVLLGSWLSGAIRKYGLKIIDGEIYSSKIQTGQEGDAMYIALEPPNKLVVYSPQALGSSVPVKMFDLAAHHMAERAAMTWYDADGLYYGVLVGEATNHSMNLHSVRGKLSLFGSDGIDLSGNTHVSGNLTKSGTLNYVEPTKDYGIRLLNALEGPELKYVDMGRAQLENGEATVYLDPILLQCIEPDTDLTPWLFKTEVYGEGEDIRVIESGENYFKVKECNGGTSNRKFGWWFYATRINYAGIRLQEYVAGVV